MSSRNSTQEAKRIAKAIAKDCIGARIRMMNRKVSRIYDEAVRPLGIKFSQMNILTVVSLYAPIQPVEVGRVLSLEKSTLSRNVALMEANGWIESLPADGNALLLRVTRQGGELLKKAAPAWREAQKEVKTLLGAQTSETILRSMNRIQKFEAPA